MTIPDHLAPNNVNSPARGVSFPGFQRPANDRRQLRPAEAVRLTLAAGDLVTVESVEGGAEALVLPFSNSGQVRGGLIGLSGETSAIDLTAFDARYLTAWMTGNGAADFPPAGLSIFDAATEAGEKFILKVTGACDLWIAAPCPRQTAAIGAVGGEMAVEVQRASPSNRWLPDPLGEIREEFTVDRATGRAYTLAKGEVVQVIDVDGRQCSDFMALRRSELDQGRERFIDSTVTRSLVGAAYPGPGLFDKFFDQDMRPLLNVVQDTVGRHDTFGPACTARGYEERGFPGHVNCSDNISDALDPYGVERRRAWPAINFFFNSWILPTDNRQGSDEAWSRAGDYVAMRAMDDLVCVTTACPDDVDPINGWNPTDIHVRIYKPDQPIRRAVAYRANATSEAILSEESAFHPRTAALTSRFHPVRDTWAPAAFDATGALEEYWACREAVTLQDMSALRKFDVMGPDAEALLQRAMTRNVAKLALHRGFYSLLCDETGAVIDDGTLFRIGPGVFRWCCGSDESARHLKALTDEHGLRVWIKSLYSAMPNLAIQGPKSRDLMRKLIFTQPTVPDIENLKWFGSTVARLHNRDGAPFQLTRSGFTGELGYEVFCDRRDALDIWDAVIVAGEEFGIKPMGNEALDIIRQEAGLMIAGAEFGPGADALECGLGFAVDFKKESFIGRDALQRSADAPRRKLTGLIFEGDEVPAHGDGVFDGERQIGQVTSATRSPTLERAIAMARLAVEFSAPGTVLEVGRLDGHMKRLQATVCEIPFVDPSRARARA